MKKLVHTLFLLTFIAIHFQLFAGWEIVYRNETADGLIAHDVILIEDGIFKYSQREDGFIYNSNTNSFIWYFNDLKGYWQDDLTKFRTDMMEAVKAISEELLAEFPEEQRDMYESLFKQMTEIYKTPEQSAIERLNVDIAKTGNTEEISGYQSEEFAISANGKIVEHLWIAPKLDVSGDIEPEKIIEVFTELFVDQDETFYYTRKVEYMQLWQKGFVMRSVDSYGDRLEVIRVVQRKINDNELKVPEGFTVLSAYEIISAQMLQGDEEYDSWD